MSPPKIEELPKKNPFASRKKTTIKRDAKEVYPRQGLNKPDFVPSTPLDVLFAQLEKLLDLPYDKLSLNSLYSRIFSNETMADSSLDQRYRVIEYLLDCLINIQKYSMESPKDKNLVSISLHDIKTFSKLINVIIIHGIYPCISSFNIGIPFYKRRLKQFTKDNITIDKLASNNEQLLMLIYTKLFQVFSQPSDVTDLLTKGTGYSDFLTISIALITQFNHQEVLDKFVQIEAIPSTYELYSTYSLLLATPGSPRLFAQFVMAHLQQLVYTRPDGLLSLIEFILGLRDNEDIQIEKFDQVADVVLQKPKNIATKSYFTSIGQQAYDLLVNINRPVVTSCVSYVIDKLWVRNKLVVHDFFLSHLHNAFYPKDGVTSEAQLNNAVNVLISLTKKSPSLDLYSEIVGSILVPLWGYFTFLKKHEKPSEVVSGLLTSYFTVVETGLDDISKNLVTDGTDSWKFSLGPNSMTEIVPRNAEFENKSKEAKVNQFINDLDFAIDCFIILLQDLTDELVNSLFVSVLKRWLNSDDALEQRNPFIMLVDLRVLESVGNKFKDILARTPKEMLEIVTSFLQRHTVTKQEDEDSDDEEEEESDETTSLLLQLLSAILTETTNFSDCQSLLDQISKSLTRLNTSQSLALASRIANLQTSSLPPLSQDESDKLVLTHAITSLNDPLVPIRAHGLYLLRQLIQAHSPMITVDFVINLHLVQLKDPEPFIYLNVIKGLEAMIEFDDSVVTSLCELYGAGEDIDERLRIGEVLLRRVQRGGVMPESIVVTALRLIERREVVVDDRLRMSAMSILGSCCRVNPLGMLGHLEQALDCALGILDLELDEDKAIMRRSAVVLIHDLVLGTSESDKVPFSEKYREKVIVKLWYVSETDSDLLVREQATAVLDTIDELVKLAIELYEEK